jgi:NAD(P)-dependent dehydrogenase (short-subunit alcohol dehydrogenase family)
LTGSLHGWVVAVTGGASGIGLATARALSERGATVFALDRSAPPDLPLVIGVPCDVTRAAEVAAAAEEIRSRSGRLDVLVNCAGVYLGGTVEEVTDEQWAMILDVNVVGMARVSRAVLPLLRMSDRPSIVNMCSVVATEGIPGRVAYSASKGAVLALTRAMAADHRPEGIRVNCVIPGAVDTPQLQRELDRTGDPAAARAMVEAGQPMKRLITAEQVARAVLYFAGEDSEFTTGSTLTVDGGLSRLRTTDT